VKLTNLYYRLRWLNVPGALLIALLQRTPVLRVATTAEELITASSLGQVLRSATAVVAALGAVHSLAGATHFVVSKLRSVAPSHGDLRRWICRHRRRERTGLVSHHELAAGSDRPGMNGSGLLNGLNGVVTGTPTTAGTFTTQFSRLNFPARRAIRLARRRSRSRFPRA